MEYLALIIDDEEDVCLLLKRFLQKNGMIADYAHTIEDGMIKMKAGHPQLILLDNNLPDGFGVQQIANIKHEVNDAQVILVSAMTHLDDEARTAGADGFLAKPLSFSKLTPDLLVSWSLGLLVCLDFHFPRYSGHPQA